MMNCDICEFPILSDEKMAPGEKARHAFTGTCIKHLLAENKQLHMEATKMKKHVKLYNRVFKALHADDKFVIVSQKTHDEMVDVVEAAIRVCESGSGQRNARFLAEAVISAMTLAD